ncbi:MAG: sulfite exporter TauE/SafE family protein [Alcaligenaceae bacterium]
MSVELWHQLFPSVAVFIWLSLAVLIAGTMRTFTGFGGGLALAPLFSLFMAPADMVVVVLLLNFVISLQTLPQTWHTTNWKMVWSVSVPALIGVPIGVWLIEWLDPVITRRFIGVVVAGLAAIMLIGWQYKGARGRLQDWFVGLTSGALTAMAGVGGPPLVLYFLSDKTITPVVLRSFFMMFFAFIQISTMMVFLYKDLINTKQILYSVSFMPVYFLSAVLGSYLFRRALHRATLIKRLSLWFLLIVGSVTIVI